MPNGRVSACCPDSVALTEDPTWAVAHTPETDLSPQTDLSPPEQGSRARVPALGLPWGLLSGSLLMRAQIPSMGHPLSLLTPKGPTS